MCSRLSIFRHIFLDPSQRQHRAHHEKGEPLSGSPTDRISSTSYIKQRFECSGYHSVCARQWHGHSPCVRLILRRLRSPEASNRGSSSIIFSCVTSFPSIAGALFIAFQIVFCLPKLLVFSFFKLNSYPPRSHSSSLFCPPAQLQGFSSTVGVSDATCEPSVHTWVSRRVCQLHSLTGCSHHRHN